ncbi:MAG: transcription elongation factor GreA [Rickettsiales bacterium]|nr:transcription elongation factor GreA [Rickettsiales bacterium]
MDKKPISRAGYDKLAAELKDLNEVQRPAILAAIALAREHGDLSENADYSAAKEKQRHIDKRIRWLTDTMKNLNVIDTENLSGERAVFGASVVLEDEDGKTLSCRLLSDFESDVSAGVISCQSPIGRAVIGKCVGDTCVVRTPSGEKEYEVMEIKFK